MKVLRGNELVIGDDDAAQASSTAEMLKAFYMNADNNTNNVNVLDWKDDTCERLRIISEW